MNFYIFNWLSTVSILATIILDLVDGHQFKDILPDVVEKNSQNLDYLPRHHKLPNLWPLGIVFYEISHKFNSSSRKIIYEAMEEISQKSCVTFIPRLSERDYVAIDMMPLEGCHTQVGYRGGKQLLILDNSRCLQHGRVMHELMHALGFTHEHQRQDRDHYIKIFWDNILQADINQFIILSKSLEVLLNFEYDYESITHYGNVSKTAAIDENKPIILPKISTILNMGQREELSPTDVKKIKQVYNC